MCAVIHTVCCFPIVVLDLFKSSSSSSVSGSNGSGATTTTSSGGREGEGGEGLGEKATAEETPLIYERGGEAIIEGSGEEGVVNTKQSVNGGPLNHKHPLTMSVEMCMCDHSTDGVHELHGRCTPFMVM